jgi:hypothetical protein
MLHLPLGFKRFNEIKQSIIPSLGPGTSQYLTAQTRVRFQACGIFVNKITLGHVILRILLSSSVIVISLIFHVRYFFYHRRS